MEPKFPSEEKPLRVRRGRVDSVDLYEIKENELDLLESGSPGGIYLNFSIFLLSVAVTTIVSLCTSTFKSPKIEVAFIIISVVGLLGGVLFLLLWWRTHRSVNEVIKRIRSRIPPDQGAVCSLESEPGPVEPPQK